MPMRVHCFRQVTLAHITVPGDEGLLAGPCMQDYKSLRAVLTTCATLVEPEFDVYILTVTMKSRPTWG